MNVRDLLTMILDLPIGEKMGITDDFNVSCTIEKTDEGWKLRSYGSSMVIIFDQVMAVGTDVYLMKGCWEDTNHIFAILDAKVWDVFEVV